MATDTKDKQPEPEAPEATQEQGVGEAIFEQVNKLMEDEKLSRTEAFAKISEQTGRRAGTVAANYYRVARAKGGGNIAKRNTSRVRSRIEPPPSNGNNDDLVAKIDAAIAALKDVRVGVVQLDKGDARLREQLRKLVS